jgi:basic membrane protein A
LIKGIKFATVIGAAALALAACSSSSSSTAPAASSAPAVESSAPAPESSAPAPESSAPAKSDIKVGLAYDIGGRGDQSFNDSAAAGLDKAKAEFGVEIKELSAGTGETDAQKIARLTLLAKGGYNPVIAVGFAYAGAVKTVATLYPKTNFAVIDDSSNLQPNVANLVFAANEASFLVGVIAAKASKAGSVGFIGGVDTPLLREFQAGFDAGAKAGNPSIKLQGKYLTQIPDFSGFNAPDKGQIVAKGMYDNGADVVYAAAGGSGAGVFKAAKAASKLAIGVDSDQYLTAGDDVKDVILTSALKRVDTSVYLFIKSAVEGAPLTGVQTFNLKNEGVGFSKSNAAVEPFVADAEAAAKDVLDGKITVPTKTS